MFFQRSIAILSVTALSSAAWSQSGTDGRADVWVVHPPSGSIVHPHQQEDPIHRPRGAWPVDLGLGGNGYPYTPTLFDADGDGAAEIFVRGGHTFALNGSGTFLPGWPTMEQQFQGYGTNGAMPGPSVADVDGDGDAEVFWTIRDWFAGSSRVWSFNAANLDGTNLPGFPQNAPDEESNSLWTPFVLGDTNNPPDNILEAWATYTLGNNNINHRVSAFDHNGNRLFVRTLADPVESFLSLYYGDVDGNGQNEMFGVSHQWMTNTYRLYVFQSDGADAPGYPITLAAPAGTYSGNDPPVPADMDADGDLEIVFGHWNGAVTQIECRNHDGSSLKGYPIDLGPGLQLFGVGLGDVTADGNPEIIVTANVLVGDNAVYVVDAASGTVLPGWRFNLVSWPKGFPTIADVDANGVQDVIFATDSGELFAVDRDGFVLKDYPKVMHAPSISSVAAGDIDGDGQLELVASTWDGWVYAWDTTGSASAPSDWPMRGIDARNTGVFLGSGGPPVCRADFNSDDVVNSQDFFDFLAAFFETDPSADFNEDDVVNSQDFFDFLTAFFAGC